MKSIVLFVVVVLAGLATWRPFEANSQGFQSLPTFDQAIEEQLAQHDRELSALQSTVALLQSQVASVGDCPCGDNCPCASPLPQASTQPVSFTQDQAYCDPTTGMCYDASGNPLSSDNCPTGTCGTMSSSASGIFTRSDGDARRPVGRLLSAVGDRLTQRPGIVGRIRSRRGY